MKKIMIGCLTCMFFWLGCGNDTEAPVVEITSPTLGTMVGATVDIVAEAEDNEEVEKVEFFIDDSLEYTTPTQPYLYPWVTDSLPDSTYHTIFVKAYDPSDNEGFSDTISVMVYNGTCCFTRK